MPGAPGALQWERLQAAAAAEGATKIRHYVEVVCGGGLRVCDMGERPAYLGVVRKRSQRMALAQLRTGSHWGAEEVGRFTRVPREQRGCQHCGEGLEDAAHILLRCPLYAALRGRFPLAVDLSLPAFLNQSVGPLASFAAACARRHIAALAGALDGSISDGLGVPCF